MPPSTPEVPDAPDASGTAPADDDDLFPVKAPPGPLEQRVSTGVAVGATTGFAIALLEVWFVVVGRPLAFDDMADRTRFAFCLVGLLAGTGGVLGALGGAIAHLTAIAAARWAARARPEASAAGAPPPLALAQSPSQAQAQALVDRTRLRLATAITAPALVLMVLRLMSGRRALMLPARPLLITAAIALGLAAVHLSYIAAHKLLGARFTGRRRITTAVAISTAVLMHILDVEVLPRLYLPFHLGLEAIEVGALLLGAGLLLQRIMPPRRWVAVALAVLSLWGARWSLRQMSFWAPLRAVAFEETTVAATVLGVTMAAHLAPRALQPPVKLPPRPLPEATTLAPGPRAPDADVFLITVDAMRADRLDPRTAPRLAALAAEGTRFEHAYSAVPHTSFSITSLLTGKYSWSLAAIGEPLEGHDTLADLFKHERYKTAAFFPPSVFFIDHDRFAALEKEAYRFEYVKYEYMGASGRTDQVIHFLESEKPDRAFVWVHYFEPHEPYEVHRKDDAGAYVIEPEEGAGDGGISDEERDARAERRARAEARGEGGTALERYDGEVSFTDVEVGRLVDWIRAHRQRAIIAFTADHGEEFGEHGGRYHGTTLYEEQVRVPLFVLGLGGVQGPMIATGRSVQAPVALVDVAPTLLGLADMVVPVRMRGRDLGPWLGRSPAPEERIGPAFSEINAKKLLARGNDRLICDVSRDFCELYDLGSDPGEQKNLAGRAPDRVASLRRELMTWMDEHSTYERAPAGGAAEQAQRALERSRLGDRGAAPEVARLLASDDETLLDRGAEALLRLPDEPAIHDAIFAAHRKHPTHHLISALALRAGDASLADPLAQLAALPSSDPGALPPSVLGEVALALYAIKHPAAPGRLRAALAVADNEELERRILRTLGESHDRAALPVLLAHLETSVRTRFETVHAIGELGDRRAVAPLVEKLGRERYVTVRAELARVLGLLGALDQRGASAAPRERKAIVAALKALLANESERVVVDEANAALAKLGAAGGARPRR